MSPSSRTLNGRYELLDLLGRGGFGEVWRSRQLSTGQLVAVKLIRQDLLALSPDAANLVARFERETRLVAKLQHQHIVTLIDADRMPDGQLYTVYEFIAGKTLRAVLNEGPLSLDRTLILMGQVLSALDAAHSQGVIHRDLKPENLMLHGANDPLSQPLIKVLDFGLATLQADAKDNSAEISLTAADTLPGTPAYMAPEQFIDRKQVGPWSDLYAWGLIFVECLTGERVVQADTPWGFMSVHSDGRAHALPPAVKANAALKMLLSRVLKKDKAKRAQSAVDVYPALAPMLPGSSHDLAALSQPLPWSIWLRAHRRGLATTGLILAGVLGLVILLASFFTSAPEPEPDPSSTLAVPSFQGPSEPPSLSSDPPPSTPDTLPDEPDTPPNEPETPSDTFPSTSAPDPVPDASRPPESPLSAEEIAQIARVVYSLIKMPPAIDPAPQPVQAAPEPPEKPIPTPPPTQVVCEGGQVAVDVEHCCWPGQSWNERWASCSGEPECPATQHMVAVPERQLCVALADDQWIQHLKCADDHDKNACIQIAQMVHGSGQHLPLAATYYARACDLGHSMACVGEGGLYHAGQGGITQDEVRALRRYEFACAKYRDPQACFLAASLYLYGSKSGIRADRKKAVGLYKQSCDLGLGESCFWIAEDLLQLGQTKAAKTYLKRCEDIERCHITLKALEETP